MEDLHAVGGMPAVMKMLLEDGMIDGDCMTVTGKTVRRKREGLPGLTPGQQIVQPSVDPDQGHRPHPDSAKAISRPKARSPKSPARKACRFSGPAQSLTIPKKHMLHALEETKIEKGDVIVIRYEGPKGGPGMPEMLTPTSAIMGAGLGKDVALITDGRFSGGSHGFIVGHITPEAQEGGPIALVRNGDRITIDAEKNVLDVACTRHRTGSPPRKPGRSRPTKPRAARWRNTSAW